VPRVRGLVVAMACAIGAVLGLSSATLADATLAACGGMAAERSSQAERSSLDGRSGQVRTGVYTVDHTRLPSVGHQLMGVVCDQRVAAAPERPGTPFVATATRHQPASSRELPPGVENPVTDRAMALLVGWAMLALVGGGLFASRRSRRRVESSGQHP